MWTPVSVRNLNRKSNNDFLFPVLLNSIIEQNLVVSKFSPQAGALHSQSMYMINNNYIFMQVRKGKRLARLVNLEICGGDQAEDRDTLTLYHVHGMIRERTIPVSNPLGSGHKQ